MQQINLYQAQFKVRRQRPLLGWLFAALMLLFLSMALWAVVQNRTQHALAQRVQQEETRNLQQLQTLDGMQQQLQSRQPSAALENQLQQLRRQLQNRLPLRQLIERLLAQESTIPFSLQRLAEKPLSQLWLTQIDLANGGAAVRLQGLAVHADAVPLLVETLSQQATFAKQRFSQLQLERQADGLYRFVLTSDREVLK